ncbi:polysaccharide pyruvyl transferase family protein [Novosphingobium lindaniclasticum]|uniref:Polysaccharide pyruvyl transferase domain-containing protein n=1 Tax=Novosphingobium lindaniclasticum LE124 TaxID=1096930 RepID=T0J4X0_9SPHN|nr:polysaccharide pyruvyl transferase family protein [Novosphingobium lindaniclasticum]EQB19195.1 hypothetical protein L284_02875 [Novosphingobium lindaniclasticum LE124]
MTSTIAVQNTPGADLIPDPELDTSRAMRKRPQRIRIFNVKYSPNLGDGLLSECLEQALIDCGAHIDTWSVDLAGRTTYGPGDAQRGALIRALHLLPPPLRKLAVLLPLAIQSQRRWRPHYDAALLGADCVVIGGGNLLVDLDLNFPTKIALAVEAAERKGLPAFLYGCGVSSGWSRKGRALMQRALKRGVVRRVFVRDDRSRLLWDSEFGNDFDLPATVVPDPGLLARSRYHLGERASLQPRDRPSIGLNITSPVAVRYHSIGEVDTAGLENWYCDLADRLAVAGYDVTLFTNGSPEDRACARHLQSVLEANARADRFIHVEPETPEELARLIASFDGLFAFRMHAVIAAYSSSVPFVALRWDPKLDSFVQSVDLGRWLVNPFEVSPEAAYELLGEAMSSGINPRDHAQVVRSALDGVAALHAAIAGTVVSAKPCG